MTNPSDLAAAQDPSPPGLRMCKKMTVPGVCRGALTYWPQLQAAVAELNRSDPSRAPLPSLRGVPGASQIGGPAQLLSAIALAPGLLHRDTPPGDLYGHFAWLTLRVYEASRTVQMTLQELSSLVDSTAGNRLAGGALVQQTLAGPGGLAQRARDIGALADAFAAQLHALSGSVSALDGQAGAATAATRPADIQGIGAYAAARMSGNEAQQNQAKQHLDGAITTILSVIGNMTLAVETLSSAWQTTTTQFDTVANGDPRELGNVDYLHTSLQADPAVQEWGEFAGVIQDFVQGLLVAPPATGRLRMVR